MIQELLHFHRKMGRYEYEEFEMFVKRDKDDEDLDDLSQKKLLAMHKKYVLREG